MRERQFPKKHGLMSVVVLSLNGATQVASVVAASVESLAVMAGQHWEHLREEDKFFEMAWEDGEDG